MPHPRFSALAAPVLAVLIGACFAYTQVPVDRETPPDVDVRVSIAPGGSNTIAAAVGPRAQELDGRTITADDSTLTLSVRTITRTLGTEENWNGDAVRIPRAAIARVERRRVDPLRTGLIAGGLVGAAILAGHAGTSAPTTAIKGGASGNPQ